MRLTANAESLSWSKKMTNFVVNNQTGIKVTSENLTWM